MIKLAVNGLDISEIISGRLISCNLTDERSTMVDQLDIELDNNDDGLIMPEPDAQLQVWLPYTQGKTKDFVDMGTFIIDTVGIAGPPDVISIQARSADIGDSLKQKREHSFEQTTLSTVLNTVAGRNNLIARTAINIGTTIIDHLDQTNESDLSFIARLGELYDAVASIKSGFLIFMQAGQAKSTSGVAINKVTIDKKQCENYRYEKRKSPYTGVKSFWNDAAYAKRNEVIIGKEDNSFVLRSSFRTEQQASDAAKAKWAALQREDTTVELSLEHGNPLIMTESPLALGVGFTEKLQELDLITRRVVHSVNESGYKTSIESEKKI